MLTFVALQAILALTLPPFANALLYFIITIFVLVSVHEFGHFISARIFGMHVPVFSVGMGQRVFGWNKIDGFTWGAIKPETELKLGENTDYRLSAIPMGGYAKIDGMIDETQTTELSSEVQPWEFRAKPWWQKSIVLSAGVILNAVLAWAIFSGTTFIYGDDLVMEHTVGYVAPHSLSEAVGMRAGDVITAVNGNSVDTVDWGSIIRDRMVIGSLGHDFWVTVKRNGELVSLHYPTLGDKPLDTLGLLPQSTPVIDEVVAASPASAAGLLKGDRITGIGGQSVTSVQGLIDRIHASKGQTITLAWLRDGKEMTGNVTPKSEGSADPQIGVKLTDKFAVPPRHLSYGVASSVTKGWHELTSNSALLVKNIAMMISGQVSFKNSVGGPIKIAQMASQSASGGPGAFLSFMALLSISLAFLNILPIPALDGGHLLIIWIEAIVGHELSQRFKLGFQKIGVALILSLMVFMVFNDIRNSGWF